MAFLVLGKACAGVVLVSLSDDIHFVLYLVGVVLITVIGVIVLVLCLSVAVLVARTLRQK